MATIELSEAVEEVRTEISRTDTKAALLLGLAGAGASVTASSDLLLGNDPGVWLVRAGTAALVVATLAALTAVRPRLTRAPFMRVPLTPAPRLELESPHERYQALSRVAATKYRSVRTAVDLITAAVVAIAAGALWQAMA